MSSPNPGHWVSRRQFLAGAAAVAGTLAGGLAACGDKRDTGPTTFRCD